MSFPLPFGLGLKPEDTIELAREAVENCFWPLYEVENGVYKLTYKPKRKTGCGLAEKANPFRHLSAR